MIRIRRPRSETWHLTDSRLTPTLCWQFFLIAEHAEFDYVRDSELNLCKKCLSMLDERAAAEAKRMVKFLEAAIWRMEQGH